MKFQKINNQLLAIFKKGNGKQGMGNEERETGNEVNHFPRNFA